MLYTNIWQEPDSCNAQKDEEKECQAFVRERHGTENACVHSLNSEKKEKARFAYQSCRIFFQVIDVFEGLLK